MGGYFPPLAHTMLVPIGSQWVTHPPGPDWSWQRTRWLKKMEGNAFLVRGGAYRSSAAHVASSSLCLVPAQTAMGRLQGGVHCLGCSSTHWLGADGAAAAKRLACTPSFPRPPRCSPNAALRPHRGGLENEPADQVPPILLNDIPTPCHAFPRSVNLGILRNWFP